MFTQCHHFDIYVCCSFCARHIKGIVSDSNNIFSWHESEDINKKILFPKFQLIQNLHFQVMHDYVWFIAFIDYCVEWSLVCETFLWKLLLFHTKMILVWFLWGSVLLRVELRKYAKKIKFWKFWERPLFNISEYTFNVAQKFSHLQYLSTSLLS